MKIEEISIEELKVYNKNAKKHPKKQIEQIKQSIEEFGMCDPIGVWGNEIVEGHGRFKACKELGFTKVPIIRLDHLTDEQRRAYNLVHNKLTMSSDFDIELLDEELENILEIDMENFGFLNDDAVKKVSRDDEDEIEDIDWGESTKDKVKNILNLGKAKYPGVGEYDIPPITPIYKLPEINEWIGFNYVLSDKNPKGKAVHFFIHDYQFERIWNNIDAYVDKLKQYECVLSPDFSPYGTMPLVTQLFNHYRKHWVGRYLQEQGIKVIPTIRASTDERSLKWFLDGEPVGGIVAYSSMWTSYEDGYEYAKKEWDLMIETLKPIKVLVYGKKLDFMEGVEIEQIDTFSNNMRKRILKEVNDAVN